MDTVEAIELSRPHSAKRPGLSRASLAVNIAAGRAREKHRLAVCGATRAAVTAGAYEIPPRAGSLGTRRAFDDLLGETASGRRILAEAERHVGRCMRRVPDRPMSVGCGCPPDGPAAERESPT